mgnify:FL=1
MVSPSCKYIIIDIGGVLETLSGSPTDRDFVLKDVGGIFQITMNGVDIAKKLTELEKYNYRVAFHSKAKREDQLNQYSLIRKAAEKKGVNFPQVDVMAVHDDIEFSRFTCDNPHLSKSKHPDPVIQIAGYEHDLDDKACVRRALQKALNIKDSERKLHYILDDGEPIIEAAEKEGWNAFLIDDNKQPLHRAIDKIYEKVINEAKQEEAKAALPTTYLNEMYKQSINPKEWQSDIVVDSKKFEPIAGGQRPDSEKFSAGIFKEVGTGKEWLGEADHSQDNELLPEASACMQRVAADIYGCFGANVVKIDLSMQGICGVEDYEIENTEVVHTMIERLPDLLIYKGQTKEKLDITNPNPDGEVLLKNGKKVPEQGLGQILAVATFINEKEPLGLRGENIGFILGEVYAKTYKIRFGDAFEEEKNEKPRTIRVGRNPEKDVILFDSLPPRTKEEFLITVDKIVDADEKVLQGFFKREGLDNFDIYYDFYEGRLTKNLLARKRKLEKEYENDLKALREKHKQILESLQSLENID